MAVTAGENEIIASKSSSNPIKAVTPDDNIVVEVEASQSQYDQKSDNDDNQDQNDEHEHEHENESQVKGKSDDYIDLNDIDMQELERRYMNELLAVNQKEDQIRNTFENYYDCFDIWTLTGSAKDNERAQKRLKVRAEFVQLAENELEEKRKHYKSVVDAFRNALTLLQAPTLKR